MRPDTATGRIMDAIRMRLANRVLLPGEKLPSIRKTAAAMGVSPSTVVTAYDRLVGEGVIAARPGSGFYVSAPAAPLAIAEIERPPDREVDPFWVSRQSLDAAPAMLKPGCGWLPPDWMPVASIRRAIRGLARANETLLLDYGGTRGASTLRRLLARRFADEQLSTDPDQILLTASGTQAIDLVCRFLLRPGDAVLVDDPCYFNFQALLKAHQAKIVGVPMTPRGPDIAAFSDAVNDHRPRLYITNSGPHNPTGATLSPQTAHQILSIAAEHGLIIVEDDIFSEFEADPSPRLAVLDGFERVIRIGSFSKTLSASIRCGFIAARSDWIGSLIDLQVATNFGGPNPIAAELISQMLADGSYHKHMQRLRHRLARARRITADALKPLGLKPWLTPRDGFYLWCTLPGDCCATQIARAALRADVVLAPGNVFSPSQTASGYMRFNVGQMANPRIYDVLTGALAECRA